MGAFDNLTKQEGQLASKFMNNLNITDHQHVNYVLDAVERVADGFFRTPIYSGDWGHSKLQDSFFAVYLIGSNLVKRGKDIDLLVATNMRYPYGHGEDKEWLFQKLSESPYFSAEIIEELPHDYNLGETKGKGLIELQPTRVVGGRKIDVVYYKSMSEDGMGTDSGEYIFNSEAEFDKKDVDREGKSLDKIILLRNNRLIFNKINGFSLWK